MFNKLKVSNYLQKIHKKKQG